MLSGREEFARRHAEGVSQLDQHSEGRVPNATLDAGHVCPVHPCSVGELLLGHLSEITMVSDQPSERDEVRIVGRLRSGCHDGDIGPCPMAATLRATDVEIVDAAHRQRPNDRPAEPASTCAYALMSVFAVGTAFQGHGGPVPSW